ncbi:hypothetical protein G6F57_009918 [Rhizopus arrhizus]|uniref:Uncharacterized protein n=1 Tax=Rhizopus oryzae TaxID=64495 RepID=A0A9P7BR70_RHIOR|nr:hypothetical protein G6F24_003803 [Rhizopus arrhizus]KAG1414016.1 hypothetical protein G6F58_007172 [Rhizopus delemar]KAG0792985.1 hypothetical protein G6F21_003958 [Rhizopus arrhizus]KAG0799015.1 hypothetical protein G6F22_003649 [Rhizopus arrhizus]KAG0814109.1 hypothetical protein G6F20_005032 [Rhizopus arrhizus]
MDADEEQFPLGNITNLDEYLDLRPPESEQKKNIERQIDGFFSDKNVQKGMYEKYSDDVKEHFLFLVYERGLTSSKTGKELKIAHRTAYNWFKKAIGDKQFGQNKRKTGRLAILGEEHQHYLKQEYKDSSSATLDQTMESLINAFKDFRNVNEFAQ